MNRCEGFGMRLYKLLLFYSSSEFLIDEKHLTHYDNLKNFENTEIVDIIGETSSHFRKLTYGKRSLEGGVVDGI